MTNLHEVLREKEKKIARVRQEIEALLLVIPLLEDTNGIEEKRASPASASRPRPTGTNETLVI